MNGPFMATCTYVLLVLTEHVTNSPFAFHEVLFADWLGKKIIVSMFKNDWRNLRPSMKAIIGLWLQNLFSPLALCVVPYYGLVNIHANLH